MLKILGHFVRDRCGATAIEYSLIAALIAIVIIGAVRAVGTNLVPWFEAVADALM